MSQNGSGTEVLAGCPNDRELWYCLTELVLQTSNRHKVQHARRTEEGKWVSHKSPYIMVCEDFFRSIYGLEKNVFE